MLRSAEQRSRISAVAGHIAAWLFFFALIIGFLSNGPGGSGSAWDKICSGPFMLFCSVFLLVFYLNYFILVPKLYFHKQYLYYGFIVLLLFAAVYFIKPFDRLISMQPPGQMHGQSMNKPPEPAPGFDTGKPPRGNKDINSIVLFVMTWSLSTAIQVNRQWRLFESRAQQAETEKVNAELAFLKSQVNPHFLFNTLNNIYSMAVTHSEHTAPSIMRLSNIMRYITDEAHADFVPLDHEIQCVKDYVDLQLLRLGSNMQVTLDVSGNTADKKIAPLLLMTFVENLFKHGTTSHEPATIDIRLRADEHTIMFYTSNQLFPERIATDRPGTGIANARRRLEHLYPGTHFLTISTAGNKYIVQLNLKA